MTMPRKHVLPAQTMHVNAVLTRAFYWPAKHTRAVHTRATHAYTEHLLQEMKKKTFPDSEVFSKQNR
jgi:hypothetical protein